MIVQAPEDGTDVVAAAKRVLKSSALETLGLQDKRDIAMLIAQSALQVIRPSLAMCCIAALSWASTPASLVTLCLLPADAESSEIETHVSGRPGNESVGVTLSPVSSLTSLSVCSLA